MFMMIIIYPLSFFVFYLVREKMVPEIILLSNISSYLFS